MIDQLIKQLNNEIKSRYLVYEKRSSLLVNFSFLCIISIDYSPQADLSRFLYPIASDK